MIEWFNKKNNKDPFLTKITKISNYDTFRKYLETEGLENCLPGIKTIDDGVNIYYKYYTPSQEKKYGVLAIHLERL